MPRSHGSDIDNASWSFGLFMVVIFLAIYIGVYGLFMLLVSLGFNYLVIFPPIGLMIACLCVGGLFTRKMQRCLVRREKWGLATVFATLFVVLPFVGPLLVGGRARSLTAMMGEGANDGFSLVVLIVVSLILFIVITLFSGFFLGVGARLVGRKSYNDKAD